MFRFLLIIFIQIFITGCDGKVSNYYSKGVSKPVDGTYTDSKIYTTTTYYPKDNLNYLNNRRKRNNDKYFASSKMYIDKKYEITSSYLKRYEDYLKVDANELTKEIHAKNDTKNSTEETKKMEFNELASYPMRDNILMLQNLKDTDNKIAIPSCIADFFEEKNKKNINKFSNINAITDVTIADDDNNDVYISNAEKKINKGSIRDDYVNSFLSWNEDYIGNNEKKFTEEPL